MKHKFRTGIYTISREPFDGITIHPDRINPVPRREEQFEIWVSPRVRGCRELDTFIHEALHAEFPKMSEKEVESSATTIAKLLWRLGYRNDRRTKGSKVPKRPETNPEGPERAGPQASPPSDH